MQHLSPPRPHGGVQYFNLFHISMILLPIIMFIIFYFIFRNKKQKTQLIFLYSLSALGIILFIAYKIYMKMYFDDFKWIENLPLQLCNINLLIIPIALLINNKKLFAFLYYIGSLAAMIGIVMFDVYFIGRNPFSFAVIVYFFYHSILTIFPFLLLSFKFYKPEFKDIFPSVAILFCIAFMMLFVNLFFINICNSPKVNYFYTMGMPGNPIMDFLYKIIPVPFLFYVPLAPILYLIDYIFLCPHNFNKIKQNIE